MSKPQNSLMIFKKSRTLWDETLCKWKFETKNWTGIDLEPKDTKITQDDPGMDQGTRVKGKYMQCIKGVLVKDTHPSQIGIAYS